VDGQGIVVAVLDTFPAPPKDVTPDPFARIQELLDRLWPDPRNRPPEAWRLVEAARGAVVSRVVNDYVDPPPHGIRACAHPTYNGRPPQVADHGLFVADIIKDIAPGADVRVYRVFTDDGVSDLHIIAQAVGDAIRDAEGQPLILNVSGGFGPQTSRVIELLSRIEAGEDPGTAARAAESQGPPVSAAQQVLDLTSAGLVQYIGGDYHFVQNLEVIDTVFWRTGGQTRVLTVAATGNDTDPTRWGRRFGPRLPAAIENVLGASAFVRNDEGGWQEASYTNFEELFSGNDGIGALGGEIDWNNGNISIVGTAPVGLYVSPTYPDGTANTTGWAYWSGTSFAAPVVSAFAACLWGVRLALGGGPPTAQEIRALIFGPANEQVLPFTQGWP
jgi:hypothetical protein